MHVRLHWDGQVEVLCARQATGMVQASAPLSYSVRMVPDIPGMHFMVFRLTYEPNGYFGCFCRWLPAKPRSIRQQALKRNRDFQSNSQQLEQTFGVVRQLKCHHPYVGMSDLGYFLQGQFRLTFFIHRQKHRIHQQMFVNLRLKTFSVMVICPRDVSATSSTNFSSLSSGAAVKDACCHA